MHLCAGIAGCRDSRYHKHILIMKHFFPLAIIALLAVSLGIAYGCGRHSSPTVREDIPADLLQRLNYTISKASSFQESKLHQLDSMKNLLKSGNQPSRQWELLITLATQYRQINADSSISYAERALLESASDLTGVKQIKSKLALVSALATAGIFAPAIDTLSSVGEGDISPDVAVDYWTTSRRLYSYMLAFVQDHGKYASVFRLKYMECDDSLLNILPVSDPFRQFIFAERLVNDSKWDEASKCLGEIIDNNPEESNIFGMAAYQYATVKKNLGDRQGYAEMLALSAQSDIKGCVKEGIALPALAYWLYQNGELDDAFRYVNFALEEANSGNIRMRTVTIAAFMPLIDEAYRRQIEASNTTMMLYLIVMSTLTVVAVGLLFVLIRNIRESKMKSRRLAATSKILEEYVGNFIGLCSNYSSRLDQFAKLVSRKINAGQTDDLLKLVQTGKYAEDDSDFYHIIDKAILDIFPDFVTNINMLLRPDSRIVLKPGEDLTPELRIYAFVRLGVDQSSKIAQILHYSTNTVYAYRNRMRNRALDRDNFDARVANADHGVAEQ